MEEIDGLEVDLDRLPAGLQPLAPAIRQWAMLDEERRDSRIEDAPTEDLAQFWLTASPHLPEVNAYLEGALETEQSNEAIVLAATAEAALEAAEVIERRTGQGPGAPPPGADA